MKEFSSKALAIGPSATLATKDIAERLKAQGKPVISFATGEPDFPTPEYVKKAAVDALDRNMTGYTSPSGTMEIKKSVCGYMHRFCGLDYLPSEIVVSSGAKHVLFAVFQSLLNPGDEVILPSPFWVTYREQISMAGGIPVVLQTDMDNMFRFSPSDLEALVTPKTKAILLTSPSNPTGLMLSADELRGISEIASKYDLYVVSDEIYNYLSYTKEFVSIASIEGMKERTIVVNGVSKTFSMTGWRIGWAACCKSLAGVISNYISHSTGNPSSISQHAAAVALDNAGEEIALMKAEFEKRRDYFKSRLSRMDMVSCPDPDGAFYFFMDIRRTVGKKAAGIEITGSDSFCEAFLRNAYVALVTGTAFGVDGYVRWTYSASMDDIRDGLDRLESFLSSLQ